MQPLHNELRGAFPDESTRQMGSSASAGDLFIRWFRGHRTGIARDSLGLAAEPELPSRPAAEG